MKYITLLRGINISGKNKISMNELKKVLEENEGWYEPNAIYPACIDACKEVIEYKMDLFNDIDKVKCFEFEKCLELA